jgi:hypothetical protein
LQSGVACSEVLAVYGIGFQLYEGSATNQIATQLDFVQYGVRLVEIKPQFPYISFV